MSSDYGRHCSWCCTVRGAEVPAVQSVFVSLIPVAFIRREAELADGGLTAEEARDRAFAEAGGKPGWTAAPYLCAGCLSTRTVAELVAADQQLREAGEGGSWPGAR